MPRKAIPLPEWVPQGCELMAKHDLSLRQAAQELGHEISIEEAEALKDRVLFKEALEQAKQNFYAEIGASPGLTKDLIVGMALKLAERLAADREDAKASEALFRLSKIMGIVGYEEPRLLQIFGTLSQRDLDRVRQELRQAATVPEAGPEAKSVN